MKTTRIISYIVIATVILLSVVALFVRQKQNSSNSAKPLPLGESNSTQLMNSAYSNSNAPSQGKIISNTLTSSNRVVVAEKNGVQMIAHIPLTLVSAMTDEQILHSLFDTGAANTAPKPISRSLNQHLAFYGLTVDDQSNVLSGVVISGSVLVADGSAPARQVQVETTSDVEGRFQFNVDNGQLIMINAKHGTNYISPTPQWFQYGPVGNRPIYYPDQNNPAVFVLTKQLLEPLIEFRKGMAAPNTGDPVRVDLTSGQLVSTGGDLIVSITCLEPFRAGVHIPWKLVLNSTSGGFAPANAQGLDDMLEAPQSGYNEIVIDHPRDDPNWDSQYNGTFYIKSRNGQMFGKLTFDMHTQWDDRGVLFGFHSFVNPSGSRNLQMKKQW